MVDILETCICHSLEPVSEKNMAFDGSVNVEHKYFTGLLRSEPNYWTLKFSLLTLKHNNNNNNNKVI